MLCNGRRTLQLNVLKTTIAIAYERCDSELVGVAFGSSVTPGSLHARIACRTASTARGRGKLRRHASATRRHGTGAVKGRTAVSLLSIVRPSAAAEGSTVMPTPDATM